MKAFGKFLLLLVLVLGITFLAWKLLETSLFNEEDEAAPPVSGVIVPSPTTQPEPPPIQKQEDLYQSTSSDEPVPAVVSSGNFTCQASVTIIGKLYDLKNTGKTQEEANEFISNDNSVPDEQVGSFIEFANTLWNSPADKIVPKTQFLDNFLQQCQSIEKAQQNGISPQ
ncbi:MAG: hypothetical protein RBR37_04350 [Advenella sp.]|nr:hypothetical protein [Advenella sp.]